MDPATSSLRREVMPPRRPSSSFGLIAVSTLAMVFAVSSSLLLFSAHSHRVRGGCPRARVMVPPPPSPRLPFAAKSYQPVPPAVVSPAQASACRGPIYRSMADGRTEVVFEQCAARPFARPVE